MFVLISVCFYSCKTAINVLAILALAYAREVPKNSIIIIFCAQTGVLFASASHPFQYHR